MVKGRLLFVTDVTLFPLDQGMRVRVANLLAACTSVFAVTLIAPMPEDETGRAWLEGLCDRTVWLGEQRATGGIGAVGAWWAAYRAAPGIRSLAAVRRYALFVAAIRTLDLSEYDLIWAERPHIARLFARQRTRTIIDFDDIEHRRISQTLSPGLVRPWSPAFLVSLYRMRLYRWLELSWSRDFLAKVVCSEEDQHYLESNGCHRIVVVPNGTNAAATETGVGSSCRTATEPLKVVFLGNIAHQPNLDAVTYFADDILFRLKAVYPDTFFDVLGPSAGPQIRERFSSRATFRGFVPDLQAALSNYDIFVAPIRLGSGTRVKLLDAMACRIPIVTTPAGAAGLPVVDGEHLLLAHDASDFAEKVVRLKSDPALGVRLATNAAALVEARFRSPAIRDLVARWLEGMACSMASDANHG